MTGLGVVIAVYLLLAILYGVAAFLIRGGEGRG